VAQFAYSDEGGEVDCNTIAYEGRNKKTRLRSKLYESTGGKAFYHRLTQSERAEEPNVGNLKKTESSRTYLREVSPRVERGGCNNSRDDNMSDKRRDPLLSADEKVLRRLAI